MRPPMSEIEPVLETDRLILEPLVVAHARSSYAALQAPELYQFVPRDPPPSPDSLAARYARLATRHSPDGQELWLNWVVRVRATGVYVGTVEVTVYPTAMAALAYQVFPPFWHHGFATEACTCVLAHLLTDCHVSRVTAEIDTRNVASLHLVERLGFTRVAWTPHADYFKGTYSDEYRYERSLAQNAGEGG